MKYLSLPIVLACLSTNSFAFEILALGTSNTNCKGANQAYTKTLNELLEKDGIKATVINAGIDGDTPEGMKRRLDSRINQNTKLVLFEPGANGVRTEDDKRNNLKNVVEVLRELKQRSISAILQSHYRIHSEEEAQLFAQTYGAYYYGHILRNIPVNAEYRQYDMPGGHTLDPKSAGHFTAKGCAEWATNVYSLVKKIIAEKELK